MKSKLYNFNLGAILTFELREQILYVNHILIALYNCVEFQLIPIDI